MGNREKIIKDLLLNSLVFIKANSIIGNGFFISNKYILTNYHIVKGASEISCSFYFNKNEKKFSANNKFYSEEKDFAILEIKEEYIEDIKNEHSCIFLSKKFPEKDSTSQLSYFYRAFDAENIFDEIIENPIEKIKHPEYNIHNSKFIALKTKNDIKEGHSGSAIYNKESNTVCGIIRGTENNNRKIAVIIPIEEIEFNPVVKESIKNYHNKINLKWLSLLDILKNKEIEKRYLVLPPDNFREFLTSEPWQEVFNKFLKQPENKSNLDYIFTYNKLTVNNENITDIKLLKNFIYLKTLTIKNTKIEDINPIENLYSLEELDLSNNKSLSNIKVIENFDKLKKLNISNTSINSIDLLNSNLELTELKIDNINIKTINSLSYLKNLKTLSLKGIELVDEDINTLLKLTNLENLTCKCKEEQFKNIINSLNNLKNIIIDKKIVSEEKIKKIWEDFKRKNLNDFKDYGYY